MNNKLIGLITSLAAVFCTPALAGAACSAEQLAINNSNYIILTKMPPMMPDEGSLTMQFSGRGKLYYYESSGSMSLSRCGRLENRSETEERDIGDNKTMRTIIHITRDKRQGWLMEITTDGSYKNRTGVDTRHYSTDKKGRITHAKGQYRVGEEQREPTAWQYLYDDQNRVIREVMKHADFPADIIIEYYYDINGHLAHITEGARTRLLRWDEQGRWLSSMLQGNAASNTMRFEDKCARWDVVGNCTVINMWEADANRAGTEREMQVNYQIHYQPNNLE
ncbi:hypothetical protein HV213_15600 [Klebsiella sp. RHBSTW-00484]|uniref:hypothetical protein n=1 Tax=unclassified Klebsiella TaxID=2608929 RepID=UPI0015E53024|nr:MULTISPECIES: hypothetical protein [unclassified Klebsiella]MBA7846947.1 hypothetical protein [Klebsiella sp. RHBSTW-00465]QLO37142.1 hypothetical protein HV213_15600 [Klebsiella sp. RHBSTW-00484]QLT76660.1 hypothetical protein HV204_15600 [Klebsiella sp. RHBSTW-00464]